MNIHVACRLNQARSIITSGVLRKLYPNFQISSSGVKANTGQLIPSNILEIARKWNLVSLDLTSSLSNESQEIINSDLVLAADNSVASDLSDFLTKKILDVTQFAQLDQLIPKDPLRLSLEEVEVELAKVTVATVRALQSCLPIRNHEVCAFLTNKTLKDDAQWLRNWLDQSKGLILDMNFLIPTPEVWKASGFDIINFNYRNLQIDFDLKSSILVSKYEVDNLANFLSSSSWLKFINKISNNVPVLLYIKTSNRLVSLTPDEILSLIHSDILIVK